MLVGTHNNVLDEKGRLAVPAKFKTKLGSDVVVRLYNVDCACLQIYSTSTLEDIIEKEIGDNMNEFHIRNITSKYLNGTTQAKIDPQGRLLLPKEKLELLGIEKEVVVTGCFNHIEVWLPQAHQEYTEIIDEQIQKDYDAVNAEISKDREYKKAGKYLLD